MTTLYLPSCQLNMTAIISLIARMQIRPHNIIGKKFNLRPCHQWWGMSIIYAHGIKLTMWRKILIDLYNSCKLGMTWTRMNFCSWSTKEWNITGKKWLWNSYCICINTILPAARAEGTWGKGGDGGNGGSASAPYKEYISSWIRRTPDQRTEAGCTRIHNIVKG